MITRHSHWFKGATARQQEFVDAAYELGFKNGVIGSTLRAWNKWNPDSRIDELVEELGYQISLGQNKRGLRGLGVTRLADIKTIARWMEIPVEGGQRTYYWHQEV